jgi:hypothetical protein
MTSTGVPSYQIKPIVLRSTIYPYDIIEIISSSGLWEYNAASPNVISASIQLAKAYYYSLWSTGIGTGLRQDITTASYGGNIGYGTPISFFITQSDEIRFNQDENQVYTITKIEERTYAGSPPPSPATSYLYLTLDRPLESSLRSTAALNSGSLIRRYLEDTSQILINGTRLIAGVPGYMKPQFLSPTLSASFDATIQELKKEGII